MRKLTINEMAMVAAGDGDGGGSSAGTYVGNAVSAACGVYGKKVGAAVACAAAGTFVGDMVDAAIASDFSVADVGDPMDTKLGK